MTPKTNCLVICSQSLAGVPPELATALEDAFIVVVDGGLSHLKLARGPIDLGPDLWVGDGDSLKGGFRALKGDFECVKLPRAKDYSDLEYALHLVGVAFLERQWQGELILLGAQGGRFDHEVANLIVAQRFLLDLAAAVGAPKCPSISSYGARGMWIASLSKVQMVIPKGELFSVLSFDPKAKITVQGAKYNARNQVFEHGAHGLSNQGLGKRVTVKLSGSSGKKNVSGPVFVVFP